MQPRITANPPNPFAKLKVDYGDPSCDDGPPPAEIHLLEDASQTILSHNDSPDVGFSWSVNPYRGCQHACAYCVSGDTRILMGDGRTKLMKDVRAGDEIYGTRLDGTRRTYTRARVIDHWRTVKRAFRVRVNDGTELIASSDHRFLTASGWKYVTAAPDQREHLVANDLLLGRGKRDIDGRPLDETADLRVVAIDDLGFNTVMYDITTGTSDFIANGVVSHNCYARPTHEYLDMGAGTDFDTKIVIKRRAPDLLRAAFDRPSWKGEMVMFSGVTDCYQPVEAELRLTRACLEVCLQYKNPVGIISKGALIERDVDVLAALARDAYVRVHVSLPFADAPTARAMEPWAPTPDRRLRVIETLAKAGVPVGVMVAPIIPGLNDDDIPKILERARAAGADSCGMVLLRLPGSVATVFEQRLRERLPLSADKVMARLRGARGEKLYEPKFFSRQTGEGPYAKAIGELFEVHARKHGYLHREDRHDLPAETPFQRPARPTSQLSLF